MGGSSAASTIAPRAARLRAQTRNAFWPNRVGMGENREKNLFRSDFRCAARCAFARPNAQSATYTRPALNVRATLLPLPGTPGRGWGRGVVRVESGGGGSFGGVGAKGFSTASTRSAASSTPRAARPSPPPFHPPLRGDLRSTGKREKNARAISGMRITARRMNRRGAKDGE